MFVCTLSSVPLLAQSPSYDFPAFDDLVAKRGLPDPFMMVDGRMVKTLEDGEALLDFADFNFFDKPLPTDFYKENFARVDSLITGRTRAR